MLAENKLKICVSASFEISSTLVLNLKILQFFLVITYLYTCRTDFYYDSSTFCILDTILASTKGIAKSSVAQFKKISYFEFPALLKRELATIPLVILTSPSGSLASNLCWSEIWGDLVKISHGERRTEREQMILFF